MNIVEFTKLLLNVPFASEKRRQPTSDSPCCRPVRSNLWKANFAELPDGAGLLFAHTKEDFGAYDLAESSASTKEVYPQV
jgi:hypothetical protein